MIAIDGQRCRASLHREFECSNVVGERCVERVLDAQRPLAARSVSLDVVEESSLTVVVDVQLVRVGDGTVLAERRITDNADFAVIGGETAEDARREAIAKIAARIVASSNQKNIV